jgi:hypothetical protein
VAAVPSGPSWTPTPSIPIFVYLFCLLVMPAIHFGISVDMTASGSNLLHSALLCYKNSNVSKELFFSLYILKVMITL